MNSLITDNMEQLPQEYLEDFDRYKKRFEDAEAGKVLDFIVLTSSITLWFFEYKDNAGIAAWAYYPRSHAEKFVNSKTWSSNTNKSLDEWKEICVDQLLHEHDWFNKDVKILIEQRGGKSQQK